MHLLGPLSIAEIAAGYPKAASAEANAPDSVIVGPVILEGEWPDTNIHVIEYLGEYQMEGSQNASK